MIVSVDLEGGKWPGSCVARTRALWGRRRGDEVGLGWRTIMEKAKKKKKAVAV